MAKILMNHHVLAVPDKAAAARFYCDLLGFHRYHEDEGWIFVVREDCLVMLGECPDAIPPKDLGDHSYFAYFLVDDASGYFAELKSRGAEFSSPLADKPWKMREFGVRSPDGYRIMVGQRIP